MPKLEELNLSAESVPEVDWNAPEGGKMPPQITPGAFTFLFNLPQSEDDWFDEQEVNVGTKEAPNKKKFLVLMVEPQVIGDKDGNAYAPQDDGSYVTLKFQKFSFYKHDKMPISFGAELLRAIGIRITGAMTPEVIRDEVRKANGQAKFVGTVNWNAYFKSTETTVATNPRKKRGDLPWPKEADGNFPAMVANPKNPNDQKQYARAQITQVTAAVA